MSHNTTSSFASIAWVIKNAPISHRSPSMQVMLGYRWLPFSIAQLLPLRHYRVACNFLSHDSALMSSLPPLPTSYSFHSPSPLGNFLGQRGLLHVLYIFKACQVTDRQDSRWKQIQMSNYSTAILVIHEEYLYKDCYCVTVTIAIHTMEARDIKHSCLLSCC